MFLVHSTQPVWFNHPKHVSRLSSIYFTCSKAKLKSCLRSSGKLVSGKYCNRTLWTPVISCKSSYSRPKIGVDGRFWRVQRICSQSPSSVETDAANNGITIGVTIGVWHVHWSSSTYPAKVNFRIAITKLWARRIAWVQAGTLSRERTNQSQMDVYCTSN